MQATVARKRKVEGEVGAPRRSARSKERDAAELEVDLTTDKPRASGWKSRGESRTGSRLSSVELNMHIAFEGAVKELHRATGEWCHAL